MPDVKIVTADALKIGDVVRVASSHTVGRVAYVRGETATIKTQRGRTVRATRFDLLSSAQLDRARMLTAKAQRAAQTSSDPDAPKRVASQALRCLADAILRGADSTSALLVVRDQIEAVR